MDGFRFTKFQDFYLRLGFLKLLTFALSPDRGSATNDAIVRRLKRPLFEPAEHFPALLGAAKSLMGTSEAESGRLGKEGQPCVVEALLVSGRCPSWLYGVTGKTVYKILDWGRNVGFLGHGNQITERGLLLRYLLPEGDAERFTRGDPTAWNPFVLTQAERIFFLYHIIEIDDVGNQLIRLLGRSRGQLGAADVGRLTCRAMFAFLEQVKSQIAPRDIPRYRTIRDLACVIAKELDIQEFLIDCGQSIARRVPKPLKSIPRRGTLLGSVGRTNERRVKNADHQAIPRCEQLVDLGFLQKPEKPDGGDTPQRRWRFESTPVCAEWCHIQSQSAPLSEDWLWRHFAATVAASGFAGVRPGDAKVDLAKVVQYLGDAYRVVHRRIGHTPFDSVAMHAMIQALTNGIVIEMADFHRIMLAVKQRSLAPEHVFFASGNALDKMFIHLKPGFEAELLANSPVLPEMREP